MPTLTDYEAATPRCPGLPAVPGTPPRDPVACGKPLTWIMVREVWACPEHGDRWNVRAELVANVKRMEQRQAVIG